MYLKIECDQEIESLNIVFGSGKSKMTFKTDEDSKSHQISQSNSKPQKKAKEEFLDISKYQDDEQKIDEVIIKPEISIEGRAPKVAPSVAEETF